MADNDSRLKRLSFRCWRRGFREADMVLGPFCDQEGPKLSEAELDAFERLLEAQDQDIYEWAIGRAPVPPEHAGPVMDKLQAFVREHVAVAVARGIG